MPIDRKLVAAFCGENDVREFLNHPAEFDGYTIMCNGHIALVMENTEDQSNHLTPAADPTQANVFKAFAWVTDQLKREHGPWLDVQQASVLPDCSCCKGTTISQCGECHGQGVVEWFTDYNNYEQTCKNCNGSKNSECENCANGKENTSAELSTVLVNYDYLCRFWDHFDDVRFAITNSSDDLHQLIIVKHSQGRGLIMPMRGPFDNHIRLEATPAP